MRILIAEGRALGLFLKQGLELDGHEVRWVARWDAAAPPAHSYDLVVAGLGSPVGPGTPDGRPDLFDRSGTLDTLARARSIDPQVLMMALTAVQSVEARVACLDRGADDCMSKPLSLIELRARCRALLRRPGRADLGRAELGRADPGRADLGRADLGRAELVLRGAGLELDRLTRTVMRDGRPVPLTNKEFALLECLMLSPGGCISRASLLAQVWGTPRDANVLDVYINYLRRKLGNEAPAIRTVRGLGYCVGGDLPGTVPSLGTSA